MASGNSGAGQRRKGRSCSPASHPKAESDGEEHKSSHGSGNKRENSKDKNEIPCRFRICKGNLLCKFWLFFEAEGKPSKRSKKGGAKGSVATWKESTQLDCVSQGSYPRKSIPREQGQLVSKHTVKFSKKTLGTKLKFGKERVHREELSKSVRLMSVVLARGNSRTDHMRRLYTKKDAPAKQRGIWRNIFTSSRILTKLRLIFLVKQRYSQHLSLQRDRRSGNS